MSSYCSLSEKCSIVASGEKDQGEHDETKERDQEASPDTSKADDSSSTAIIPTTKRPYEDTSGSFKTICTTKTSSSVNGKEEEQLGGPVKKKSRRTNHEQTPQFPLIILLNSHFFFGTSLSFVNREAAAHTRNLAQYGNKITRFVQKRYRPQMYYETYTYSGQSRHGPATCEGPVAIDEDSMDVFMVSLSMFHFWSVQADHRERSLRTLSRKIWDWWKNAGQYRIATGTTLNDYCLPSGRLVDFCQASQNLISCIYVRGAVIRGYLRYNNIFRSLVAPLDGMTNMRWWIDRVSNEMYGYQDNPIHINVYRDEEGFVEATQYDY